MTDLKKNKEAFLNLKKPRAIIFDWDNTLVNTWPLIQSAINAAMRSAGRETWSLEKVRNNVHKSMRESFPEIFGDDWRKAGEVYKAAYHSINIDQIQFLPNALKLIEKIEELGILQFIVSNKVGITLRKEAAKLGVERKFFALIGSQDAPADKPSKEPVQLALMGCDLELGRDEIWFVGDTIADVDCAYNSRCTPVVYAETVEQISKTIPRDFLSEGKNGEGALPIYFDHQEMIEVLEKLK